jgi:hypothetical protein
MAKPKGKIRLADLSVNRAIILKRIFKREDRRTWIGILWLSTGVVCEHDGPLGTIQCI